MASEPVRAATGLALLAAALWASYYGFILGLNGHLSGLALIAYPFIIGGIGYAIYCSLRGEGGAFLRLFRDPAQWGRIGMFLGIQVSVVYITLVNGAVDAALLSLVGDVALTPLLVMAAFSEGRDRLRSRAFVGGLVLSGAGASLTIVAGGSLQGFSGWSWIAAPAEAVLIAAYFVSAARAGRTTPVTAIAGQASLVAGLVALPFALVLPASYGNLSFGGPLEVVLLVGVGITSFFLAPAVYFAAIGRAGIFLPSLLMAAIPVFTLGVAALVAGEYPTALGVAGVPIAVVGGVLAVRGSQSSPGPDPAP
jgi:drug/metabolite transporter (DMT)-like permease